MLLLNTEDMTLVTAGFPSVVLTANDGITRIIITRGDLERLMNSGQNQIEVDLEWCEVDMDEDFLMHWESVAEENGCDGKGEASILLGMASEEMYKLKSWVEMHRGQMVGLLNACRKGAFRHLVRAVKAEAAMRKA